MVDIMGLNYGYNNPKQATHLPNKDIVIIQRYSIRHFLNPKKKKMVNLALRIIFSIG